MNRSSLKNNLKTKNSCIIFFKTIPILKPSVYLILKLKQFEHAKFCYYDHFLDTVKTLFQIVLYLIFIDLKQPENY